MIYHSDCLNVLKGLPSDSVDLIYLDPPFFSQKKHNLSSKSGKEYSFDDVWESRQDYLDYMKVRLEQMKRVLKPTESLFLHCDSYASWYLKILLDDVFGEENFRSEIIWAYKRWSNSSKSLLPNHQNIFYFTKTKNYKFNPIFTEYSPTTNVDQILQDRERNAQGKAVYKKDADGNVVMGGAKKGVPLSDVWEIPFFNPKAKERTGYPTQKPIELLDRIIKLVTDEGDLVLDPFCGSGTTLVAAKLLSRQFIGIDKSEEAVNLTKSRLETPVKTTSNLLKVGIDAYNTKTEDELTLLKQLDCDVVQRNRGIDGFLRERFKDAPVAVKIHKSGHDLAEAIELLHKAGKSKNCSFTVLVSEQTAITELPENMILINPLATSLKSLLVERTA